VDGPVRGASLVAVAADGEGRLAAAEAGRVWLREAPAASWRRVAVRGPLRDLAWTADGALVAAGEQGVWRIGSAAGAPAFHPFHPGTGERDRFVTRLARAGRWLAAAGEGGVFLSRLAAPRAPGAPGPGAGWRRLSDGLPNAPSSAIAFAFQGVAEEPFELWASVAGRLYRVGLDEAGPGPARRVAIGGAGADEPLADLVPLPGGGVVALGADWLAAAPDWRTRRLGLPPGALARRGVAEPAGSPAGEGGSHGPAQVVCVASDHGVFRFAVTARLGQADSSPLAPLAPLGAAPRRRAVRALAPARGRLYAAGEEGLFVSPAPGAVPAAAPGGMPAPLSPPAVAAPHRPVAGAAAPGWRWVERAEPGVRTVQMAALAYLGIGPGRMRALQRGVDRRGWLPEIQIRADAATGRDADRDLDRAFTSGALRELLDERVVRSRDYGVTLTLSWDLGDAAFHPDSIDVSRETRALVELRDDVLDEVNRLYFERLRVLASLDRAEPEEVALLRLRAAELAAGLDAWTGGWFGRHLGPALRAGPP
jgi:hypothetical protein